MALALPLLLLSCSSIVRLSLEPFYKAAPLAAGQEVEHDIAYADTQDEKQRLDLYSPVGDSWDTLIFVHGGSFDSGDKDLELGGLDIYANVGRFYSSQGLGVALVDYRLQPEATWPDQVDDVAAALAWTLRNTPPRGGSGRVFLSGHSAGAWLASRVALDETVLAHHGLEPSQIAGVITISGSGFDLTDRKTWEMYPREEWWGRRFRRPGADRPWQEDASLVPLVDERTPRFLLLHSDSELLALERQNRIFLSALRSSGVPSELVRVDHGSHRRIVLAMSRSDREVTRRILEFVGSAR